MLKALEDHALLALINRKQEDETLVDMHSFEKIERRIQIFVMLRILNDFTHFFLNDFKLTAVALCKLIKRLLERGKNLEKVAHFFISYLFLKSPIERNAIGFSR